MTAVPAFLSRLCEADRAALAERWSTASFLHSEFIVAHGDLSRDVFFLLEGRARVTLYSEDGKEIAYRDLAPGDIFGELACIDGRERSASVVAREPTYVAHLPPATFRKLVENHPRLAWTLLEHLSGLLRRMTDRVYEFSTLVVRERLILELLRRAEEAGPLRGKVSITPAPTHFELASQISSHREAVSREMSDLAKRKLIEKRGNSLVLHDLAALEALAGKDD